MSNRRNPHGERPAHGLVVALLLAVVACGDELPRSSPGGAPGFPDGGQGGDAGTDSNAGSGGKGGDAGDGGHARSGGDMGSMAAGGTGEAGPPVCVSFGGAGGRVPLARALLAGSFAGDSGSVGGAGGLGPQPCGGTCPPTQVCRDGACSCPDQEIECAPGVCSYLPYNHENCGACGHACGSTQICDCGTCTCSPGFGECSPGVCLSLSYDPQNCGACGHACAAGQRCVAGACGVDCPFGEGSRFCAGGDICLPTLSTCGICPPDTTACEKKTCNDLTGDVKNCGACGNACGKAQACVDGACVCPAGTVECSP